MGKLGFYLPRTISEAISGQSEDEPEPFHVREHVTEAEHEIEQGLRHRGGASNADGGIANPIPHRVRKIGRSIIDSNNSSQTRVNQPPIPLPAMSTPVLTSRDASKAAVNTDDEMNGAGGETEQSTQLNHRTIRFPDETH